MQSAPTTATAAQAETDWSCIQSGLSVLINMTHNNTAGCQAVAAAGGLAMAVDIIVSCMQSQHNETADAATPRRALAQVRQHVLIDVGPITAALGLLINLVESSTECREQLKRLQLPEHSPAENLQQLLCKLMQARTPVLPHNLRYIPSEVLVSLFKKISQLSLFAAYKSALAIALQRLCIKAVSAS